MPKNEHWLTMKTWRWAKILFGVDKAPQMKGSLLTQNISLQERFSRKIEFSISPCFLLDMSRGFHRCNGGVRILKKTTRSKSVSFYFKNKSSRGCMEGGGRNKSPRGIRISPRTLTYRTENPFFFGGTPWDWLIRTFTPLDRSRKKNQKNSF